jgi:hypothetical protein
MSILGHSSRTVEGQTAVIPYEFYNVLNFLSSNSRMIAAAQAAAEAAMREAMERDRSHSQNQHSHQYPSIYEQVNPQRVQSTSNLTQYQQQINQESSQDIATQNLLNEMVALSGGRDIFTLESMLELMTQQEELQQEQQQQQQQQDDQQQPSLLKQQQGFYQSVKQSIPNRPSVQYMTIADDGAFLPSFLP